ncbi:MAG: DUF480 domain-containing protein [Planctomycetota bacterium]|nr:DUF480 domain-containing protein [Planctomycetota bacterium]
MGIDLQPLEQRVVGVLIEKQYTVPDAYPLTLNALLAGCNQKSNRSPHMEVMDWELEGAVRGLMDRGWVTRVERDSGRAMRYSHQAKEQLGVEAADLAILSELLCRGPQTPTELKTRAARMAHVGGPADVEDRLQALASRPVPYVTRLPKRPREQMQRWCHLLDGRTAEEAVEGYGGETPAPAAPSAAAPSAPRPTSDPLVARIDELEAEVADLKARLDRLEGTA